MISASPRPVSGPRPIKTLIRSMYGQRMVKVKGKFAVVDSIYKISRLKNLGMDGQGGQGDFSPIAYACACLSFLYLYLVFIGKCIDQPSQAIKDKALHLDQAP